MQLLRDVKKTPRYLRDVGVIVLHDCKPPNALIGRPAASYDNFVAQQREPLVIGIWIGDVWKEIVHLHSTHDDPRVAVLKCDMGVGATKRTFGFAIVLLASGGRGVRLQRSRRRPRSAC